MIALLLAAAFVVTVVAQNSHDVGFDFLWWSLTAPLAVLLLCTALLTLVVDQLVGAIWRGRRRRMRNLESGSRSTR